MDPNPATPQPQPQPQPPVQPPAPTPTATPPVQPPAPSPLQSPLPAPAPPKKSSKKIILIILLVVALPILAVFAWFAFATISGVQSMAQSKNNSNAFMSAMTTNNIDEALKYSTDTSESAKQFLMSMAPNIQGKFSLRQESTRGESRFYLYTVEGATNNSARTELKKSNGKWLVEGFNTGSNLAVMGTENTATDSRAAVKTATACLSNDDYKWMNYDKSVPTITYDKTYDPAKHTDNYTSDMFFNPDTTNEKSFTSIYDDWADFAKHNTDKQWRFILEGSTYGSDAIAASSQKLATDRAAKVKTELIKRGVPDNRIIVKEPHNYGVETQDDSKDQIYRRVEITVDPTCS